MGAKVWALGNGGGGGEQSKEALWEGVSAGRVLLWFTCSPFTTAFLGGSG